MKRVSIKDVARAANVSHSTVSRALRHSKLVNAETAEKIQRIADELGYRVSAVGRSLVTERTNTVGVVASTISNPFVAEVVSGIEEVANDHDYSVILANSNRDPEREVKAVRLFDERRVDGIVITASRVGAVYSSMLAQLHIPIVLLNSHHPSEFAYSVIIADLEASRDATRHLIELGHRSIAYIADRFGYQSDTERFAGYRSALDESDIPFRPEYVVHGDGKPRAAMEAMEHLLALSSPPTAVFCYNDMSALGALKIIKARGLQVPRDVSLVGFDDLFVAEFTDPPLTTVRQPKHKMGRMAMEMLLTLLRGEDIDRKVQVPGELVIRESTAPPRQESRPLVSSPSKVAPEACPVETPDAAGVLSEDDSLTPQDNR